ncbi:type IV pilin N-terminal domain-containing protein [uncultured Methanocorpusculum sp.]|nr:type IV pilin N-terminal domain-containing protein [uncultured Methanocorpusculum sp.]
MKARPEAAISPTIGVILLIFLTVVLVGIAGLVFFGFADNLTEPKHAYITAETTGNTTNPLVLRVWDIGGGTVLKDLIVSVNTPDGISIGTPTKISNAFYVGETIPIEFDDSFPKGNYLVTVTGEFADGAKQVLFTKNMELGADGQKIKEVSTEKLFLMANYAYWAPNKIYLTDTTPSRISRTSHTGRLILATPGWTYRYYSIRRTITAIRIRPRHSTERRRNS